MATVALCDMETTTIGTPLYSRISQYIKSGIMKQTGLNLIEFLSLPKEIVQFIYEECEKQSKVEIKAMDGLQKQLNEMKKD